jgi:hypothetical protein
MEADSVSETLCSLVFRIPDDGQIPQNPSNSKRDTARSERFRNYFDKLVPNYSLNFVKTFYYIKLNNSEVYKKE